ncbi:hypothetical protein ASA1KI_35010 [Opitutales bacterium ASA1]|uniref:lipid-A-disaccharide synthase N-terminal domain-containing protein n=1 Tax=Congregicoccus parvus TaxID=3081749 RepID=UPI002B2DB6F5|nr:hypothetical protein ASA1KI_35010 [Opitutales bacterium ASA1]
MLIGDEETPNTEPLAGHDLRMSALREAAETLVHPIGILGLVGQACFFSRFLLQWIVSERRGRSTMPVLFWYFSIVGSILVLIYALWKRDPVFVLGQSVGMVVYIRNLALIRRSSRAGSPEPVDSVISRPSESR